MSFAPHGWKTVLDLRYLKLPYETVYVTLAELRTKLPGELGLEKVTVPVGLRPDATFLTYSRLYVLVTVTERTARSSWTRTRLLNT